MNSFFYDGLYLMKNVQPRMLSLAMKTNLEDRNIPFEETSWKTLISLFIPLDDERFLQITDDIIQKAGLKFSTLLKQAKRNIEETIIFRELNDMLPDELYVKTPHEIYVLSTNSMYNGAAAILSDCYLQKLAETLGDYYIIPSSIRECLVLRRDTIDDPKALYDLMSSVNDNVVSPDEILAYQILYYSKDTKELQALF